MNALPEGASSAGAAQSTRQSIVAFGVRSLNWAGSGKTSKLATGTPEGPPPPAVSPAGPRPAR
eukprot:15471776-Alexandrium_andersonii.AAC.1